MITSVSTKEIEDVLMEPGASGLKESYFIIHGDAQDIIILNAGKNGQEFNKTEGYFRRDNGVGIFHYLFGQGILLMQRNDQLGEAKEFKVVTLQPGKQVVIPAGFAFAIVNIGKSFLVGLDNSLVNSKDKDFESIKERKGFAYYIVEKKGEIAFETNPSYQVHPQIATE